VTILVFLMLGAAVTLSMAGVDFAHARYVQALQAGATHRAARWSVVQWASTAVGFIVAVKVTFWLLPFEPLGLYLGTWLGTRRAGMRVAPACQT
jgi:hypothetical protein